MEYIESGGLDKAAEREKLELQEELRRIRNQKTGESGSMFAGSGGMGGAAFGSGRGSGLSSNGRFLSESIVVRAFGGLLRAIFK